MTPELAQQIIPEVTNHPNVSLDVMPAQDGNLILFADVLGPVGVVKRLMFPMDAGYAERLGKKLTAPRVVVPGQNGHGSL